MVVGMRRIFDFCLSRGSFRDSVSLTRPGKASKLEKHSPEIKTPGNPVVAQLGDESIHASQPMAVSF